MFLVAQIMAIDRHASRLAGAPVFSTGQSWGIKSKKYQETYQEIVVICHCNA